jgi:hypothetical protein
MLPGEPQTSPVGSPEDRQENARAGSAGWKWIVPSPYALARKYPRAATEWGWQYVFPAPELSTDPRSGARRRHHFHERGIQRAFREAVRKAGIVKPATCHTLRHSFCHSPAGGRLRYPDGAGASRPPEREDHDDLYPRPQPWRPGGPEPCGHPLTRGVLHDKPSSCKTPAPAGGTLEDAGSTRLINSLPGFPWCLPT